MSNKTEIIDLTSSSSSSSTSSNPWDSYFPYNAQPWMLHLTKKKAKKKKHDVGEPSQPPIPEQEYDFPLLSSSDDDSSENENEDPTFVPPSIHKRSQSRPRKSNPSLPKSREVVIGLPAPGSGASYHGSRGKSKDVEVKGKGKEKVE